MKNICLNQTVQKTEKYQFEYKQTFFFFDIVIEDDF